VNISLAEGWRGQESAVHQIAFVALPDERTVIGLQHCRTVGHRTYLAEIKGLHLNLPNDLYNQFKRRLITAQGDVVLTSPPGQDRVVELGSSWANVDDRLGVLGLYGAEQLVVHQSWRRRGGKYASLYVDEICFHCALGTKAIDPSTVILDVGWAVLSDVDHEQTRRFAQEYVPVLADDAPSCVRGVSVRGLDGRRYVVVANFAQEESYPAIGLLGGAGRVRDLVTGEEFAGDQDTQLTIQPCQARVLALDM